MYFIAVHSFKLTNVLYGPFLLVMVDRCDHLTVDLVLWLLNDNMGAIKIYGWLKNLHLIEVVCRLMPLSFDNLLEKFVYGLRI